MRDEKRIDPFLKEIRKIWKLYPTLRFGQLLLNTTNYPNSLYYIEEDQLLKDLKTTYGKPVKNVIIIGAAGRDFHNFNVYFKNNENYNVVAFTATQIPGIDDKIYPSELSGELYPNGIPIIPEDTLDEMIIEFGVELCVFAYSDVTYDHIANISNMVLLYGSELITLSPEETQLDSVLPVISVTATRTGCGKSSVSKKITELLTDKGYRVGVIRHPMPYADDLNTQAVQKFATSEDLEVCTIEEREEYEPYVSNGMVIWAGIDYETILREAEKESDIILWDGGNNDFSFIKPDLSIVVADPLRVGDELSYYPSDINIKMADVVVINKCDSASEEDILELIDNIKGINKSCKIIETDSIVTVDNSKIIIGADVVVVEDGPTLTHGGMTFGAGVIAAEKYNAMISKGYVYAVGSIKETYDKYKHISTVIPAMGYSNEQLKDLEDTINATPCNAVIIATPIDLGKLIDINKPYTRVHYDIEDGKIDEVIEKFLFNESIEEFVKIVDMERN